MKATTTTATRVARSSGSRVRSSAYEKAKVRLDSWVNAVTGLGTTARDKVYNAFFQRSRRLSDAELEDLYNGDDLAAKIAGKVVEDALRGSYELVIGVDEETRETVSDAASQAEGVRAYLRRETDGQ